MTIDQQLDLKSICQTSSPMKVKNICDYVYVLLGFSFFAIIASILLWNVHKFNDLSVLREKLKNDLIVNDIKQIVQAVLKDIENQYQPLHQERKR